jgi:hypothetical protein
LPILGGVILSVTFGASAFAQSKGPLAGNENIGNDYRVRPDVATKGQPSDEGLEAIKAAGLKTILNPRTEQEGSLEEKAKVESLGLNRPWDTALQVEAWS